METMTETGSNRLAIARFVILIVVVLALGIGLTVAGTDGLSDALESASESRWGAVAFIALYIVLVIIVAPGTAATISAALLFGFQTGLFISVVGASVGATIAFLISRAIGRDGAVALLGKRLQSVDRFIGEREFSSMLVLRVLPVVPFNMLNYAAGLTAISFSRYVAATVLGILPGTTLATFTASRSDEPTSPAFIIGLVAAVAALIGSGILARRFTARHTADA